MNEPAIGGLILSTLSTAALGAGLATGEMPSAIKSLDTGRATAPFAFWCFGVFHALFAVLGLAIAARYEGV